MNDRAMPKEEGGELVDVTSLVSLREQAYDLIRDLLLSGEFAAEEPLSEAKLGERLHISRTPVREALMRLADDGLVETRPNGTRVVANLLAKVPQVIEVRLRLEPFAAALAARRMTSDELEELMAAQDRMEELLPDWDRHEMELLRGNTRFHRYIVQRCGNPTLVDTLKRLEPFSVFPRILSRIEPEQRRIAFAEHRQILDALWKREEARVEHLTYDHIARALNSMRAQVRKRV